MSASRALSIVQVGAFPFPTHQGSQVYVRGMSQALARRGHRVTVAAYSTGNGDDVPGIEIVRGGPIPGKPHLASGLHWSKAPHNLKLISALRRRLSQGHVDVIHAHNIEAPLLSWVAKGLGRSRPPLVYNLHTVMQRELPTYLSGRISQHLGRRVGWLVDRLAPAVATANVAISPAALQALRGVGARRVVHVPPGVDLAELQGGVPDRARTHWNLDDRAWVVYVGNGDGYQDLQVWFEAMARLDHLGLLMVTGSETAAWTALAKRFGIGADRVRVVHTADFADHLDALAVASVAVLPRADCAGFPIKLLNYLGVGVPTVAAQGSAQPIEGVVVVPNLDPGAMADAIEALASDPVRRAALSDAARSTIAAGWTWDVQAARLEGLYREILG